MQETKSSLFHRMNELKTDKLKMLVAFGKAQADKKLERVTWQDSQGTTYTANLEKANLNIIDTTQAILTYEVYREYTLIGSVDVVADVELTIWADKISPIKFLTKLDKGLKDGSIKLRNGCYEELLQNGNRHVIGIVGEEEGINIYLEQTKCYQKYSFPSQE